MLRAQRGRSCLSPGKSLGGKKKELKFCQDTTRKAKVSPPRRAPGLVPGAVGKGPGHSGVTAEGLGQSPGKG